ncbi:MAG: response regulator [Leptolyngbyaceae cyanobacterium bins.349]|nr:response regulator [Leptolyngbyaceae cyanobacterium bins.349]
MKKSFSSNMDAAAGYILLLAKHPRQVRFLSTLLGCSSFAVQIACSEEQAVVQATERPPFLVILAGDHLSWSQGLLRDLRTRATANPIMLVALTDFHDPSWVHQEENPGFDGFLVSPISSEVLSSLVQSAYTRQACFSFR